MTGINEWVKLAVLDFEENPYYAQNGVNRSISSLETFKPEIKIDVVKSALTLCANLIFRINAMCTGYFREFKDQDI